MNDNNTPFARATALNNTLLRIVAGSQLFGTALPGHADRDELGICIEPPDCVIGLEKFEMYSDHLNSSGSSKPEHERSGPGDLDITINSLRLWSRSAAGGDCTSLCLLFAPETHWVKHSRVAFDLQAHSDLFFSREAGSKFLGYLDSQLRQLERTKAAHTNRPELIEALGHDTKAAYHAVRIGIMGVEYLSTGRITLPMKPEDQAWLIDHRLGHHSKDEAIQRVTESIADIHRLRANPDIPDRVNRGNLNNWIIETYLRWWDLTC